MLLSKLSIINSHRAELTSDQSGFTTLLASTCRSTQSFGSSFDLIALTSSLKDSIDLQISRDNSN